MIVDNLTLIKLISNETCGPIYLSSRKGDNSYYITQIYIKSKLSKFDLLNKYLNNEISILLDTNHPNIIKLFEIKETKDKIYLVKEYCNGEALQDMLFENNNEPFSEEIVQYIMRQLIEAVKYLHNKKIICRDLKLDNIKINYEDEKDRINNNIMKGKIKITDLNVSRYLAKGELAKSIIGSFGYEDPSFKSYKWKNEEENKDFGYDQKVDIWNLGIIFYELLVGKNPFKDNSIKKSREKLDKGDYFVPASISKEALSFLNWMLQNDPKRRKNADILYNHPFLRKNVNNFTKIKEDIDKSEIKMNIKNNDYEILNILNEFESNF